ncbi:MAG: carbohydrate binding domain-containing protein [Myxococcota bacterium]
MSHSPGTDQVHEVSLRQPGKSLVAGRWYRFSYWARAASARTIRAAVWNDHGGVFSYREQPVDATWHHFVDDFRATTSDDAVAVEFHLAAPGGATVWLDGVRLEDMGADPGAAPDAGRLISDGAFSAGALCWGFSYDADATLATATSDADAPTAAAAPSLKFTQDPGLAEVYRVGTYQGGLTTLADRWYRLSFDARAAAARPLVAAVWDDVTAFAYETPTLGTSWQHYSYDYVTTVGSAAGETGVSFQLADPSGAAVWLDNARIEDLGPSPCAATSPDQVRDGELSAGLLCWFEPSPSGRYEVSSDHAPGTAAPSLAITNLVADDNLWDVQLIQRGYHIDAGSSYTLTFSARAAAPRTIVALVHNWDTGVMQTYQVVDVGTAWETHSFTFDGQSTEDNVLVELQLGQSSTETVWLDGIHLAKNSAAVPTAGLVAYYPFDGNAADASGNGNDGVVYNSATLTTDKHGAAGKAYAFDGVSAHIRAPTAGFPVGVADRTIAFWLAPTTAGPGCGSTGSSVVYYGTGDCPGHIFGAGYCQSSWYFWGGCYDQWPGPSDPAYQAITPGQWSFVAVRLASGLVTVRVNDIVQTFDRSSENTLVGDLLIGAETIDGGQSFRSAYQGKVDEVRVYDRALDDAELQALFDAY